MIRHPRQSLIAFVIVLTAMAMQFADLKIRATTGTPSATLMLGARYAVQDALLSGVVVSADGVSRPIRRAIVMLTGPTLPANLSVVTDDEGRFSFPSLLPGRYTVTASKPAHITSAYGANRPGRPGTTITIAAGQRVTDVIIPLARGAVISGVVRDALGDPAPGISVSVMLAELVAGLGGYATRGERCVTDDRGQYRAYGLPPGEYVIAAIPRTNSLGEMTQPSTGDVARTIATLRQGGGSGRGAASIVPGRMPMAAPAATLAARQTVTYAPVFYPGTPVPADARRLRVNAGDVLDGIDVSMDLVPTTTIDGLVVSAGGVSMSSVQVSLTQHGPPLPVLRAMGSRRPTADGRFTITGVTPGRYTLLARGTPGTPPPPPAAPVGRGSAPPSAPIWTQHWAMAELNVSGTPIGGLTLTLRPPMELSGRVVFESSSRQPPADLTTIRIGLTSPQVTGSGTGLTVVNGVPSGGISPPPTVAVAADGTFTVRGILPGTYTLTAVMPGSDDTSAWWLKSAVIGSRDVLDTRVEFGIDSQDVSGTVVTFSDRRTELSGTLQAVSGQPASDYCVVVFAADRAYWGANSRRVTSTRPGNDGSWIVRDRPAGDYLIAALTDVEPGEWQRPEFLAELVAGGVRIQLSDGARVRQDLRISK